MASTTVKIRMEDKERLDRLKAKLLLKGLKLNQEELLSRIISFAETYPLFLEDEAFSVDTKRKKEILSIPKDMGPSSEEDIDTVLYGEPE